MDGFIFDSSGITDTTSDAIDCAGGGAANGATNLTIVRSTIKGAPVVGLSSQNKCTITLDADIVASNKGGGILLVSSDFTFTNLLVRDNGTTGTTGSGFGGIDIATAGETGRMTAFNLSILNNKAKTSVSVGSGFSCSAPPTTLANTVVFGGQGGGYEMLASDCSPTYSAFAGAMLGSPTANNQDLKAAGGPTCAATDLFVDPNNNNFAPKKGGTTPCSLVNDGTNTGAPDHDLVGTPRPQPPGGTDDIGCYEAK
jgi:hypothetical protein